MTKAGSDVDALSGAFFSGHDEKCKRLLISLNETLTEAFKMCEAEMMPFTKTAFEFCQTQTRTSTSSATADSAAGDDESKIETDVEVLKSTLSSLRQQQAAIKGIS